MARFRNAVSGVVIDVDESAAMRLPGSWEPVEGSKGTAAKKTPAKKRTSRKTETDSAPAATSDAAGSDDE